MDEPWTPQKACEGSMRIHKQEGASQARRQEELCTASMSSKPTCPRSRAPQKDGSHLQAESASLLTASHELSEARPSQSVVKTGNCTFCWCSERLKGSGTTSSSPTLRFFQMQGAENASIAVLMMWYYSSKTCQNAQNQ